MHYHDHDYYYDDGYYYRYGYYDGELAYVGVEPPVGIAVGALPSAYETVVVGDTPYYQYNDVYYQDAADGGYAVVEPPAAEAAPEEADSENPFELLSQMSDFLAQATEFSFDASETIDGVLDSGQSVQLSARRKFLARRPDGIYAEAKGDHANRKVWYDGDKIFVLDVAENVYGSVEAPDTIDGTLDFVAEEYGVTVPLADLLHGNFYEATAAEAETGRYVGINTAGYVPCHHLAFEGASAAWQIWISVDDRPLPRKLVIAEKDSPSQPRYTATMENWIMS
ncbi:MAG: DUF6515 family protein, partial [Planctomycetota bacterium]